MMWVEWAVGVHRQSARSLFLVINEEVVFFAWTRLCDNRNRDSERASERSSSSSSSYRGRRRREVMWAGAMGRAVAQEHGERKCPVGGEAAQAQVQTERYTTFVNNNKQQGLYRSPTTRDKKRVCGVCVSACPASSFISHVMTRKPTRRRAHAEGILGQGTGGVG